MSDVMHDLSPANHLHGSIASVSRRRTPRRGASSHRPGTRMTVVLVAKTDIVWLLVGLALALPLST